MLITVAIGIITVSLSSAVFYKYFLDATGGVRAFLAAKRSTVFCTVRTYLFNSVDVTLIPRVCASTGEAGCSCKKKFTKNWRPQYL